MAYVNGEPVSSWANVTFKGNGQDLFLGSCSCGGYFFNGTIAFFRVYNHALSTLEIQNNYLTPSPVSNGLVLWLSFDQTPGSSVVDLSGYGNNGTLSSVSFAPSLGPCSWYTVLVT